MDNIHFRTSWDGTPLNIQGKDLPGAIYIYIYILFMHLELLAPASNLKHSHPRGIYDSVLEMSGPPVPLPLDVFTVKRRAKGDPRKLKKIEEQKHFLVGFHPEGHLVPSKEVLRLLFTPRFLDPLGIELKSSKQNEEAIDLDLELSNRTRNPFSARVTGQRPQTTNQNRIASFASFPTLPEGFTKMVGPWFPILGGWLDCGLETNVWIAK